MESIRKTTGSRQRYIVIDVIRGLAVVLMIIFHSAFDLRYYRFIHIDFFNDPLWFWLPRFIVFLFLICVGMGLSIVHKRNIRWAKVGKRFLKLGGAALSVTCITYIIFPKNFIFFGTLHCIAVASVVGVFFVKRPGFALVLGLLLVLTDWIFQPRLLPISEWLDVAPVDYIPVYPWIGFVFLGIFFESVNLHKLPLKANSLTKGFEILGRHSLAIYLIHQPVIFGTVHLVYLLNHP
jgi:uncharacterized membrane protein